jgi:hypothetical protein
LANIKIPERFRDGLRLLATIPAPAYEELFAALRSAPSSFVTDRELSAWISSEVKAVPEADITKIVQTLASLHRLMLRTKVSVSKLAADAGGAARELFKDVGEQIDERLSALLPLNALNIISEKGKELQAMGEKILHEAQILTDIRPVFGDSLDEAPKAAVVIHTLRIDYHESVTPPCHRELFFSLDADDIAQLKKTLERAEAKEKSLRLVLEKAQLKSIDNE